MKNLVASLLIGSLAQVSWAAPATPAIDVYKSPASEIGGDVVEGHVLTRAINHPLKANLHVRGLVVPAMPVDSPGMEAGGRKDYCKVFLVNRGGPVQAYAQY
jgi:hypothetical protein